MYVAEEGVAFHRHNGKSNLENVKTEKLYDVLLNASRQRDKDEIINLHYQKESQK